MPVSIAGWVAEKFAAGIVSGAGGRAFSEALSVLGLGGDRSPEILEKLADIDAKASEILDRIKDVQAELKKLGAALSLTEEQIEVAITENTIAGARTIIQSHYGKRQFAAARAVTAGLSTANSLLEALDYTRGGGSVDTQKFADNVLGVWSIRDNVSKIASAAAEGLGSTQPLLRKWGQLLIDRIRVKGPVTAQTLLQSYLTLEGWFQQLLEPQFQGIALVISAKCHGKPLQEWPLEVRVTMRGFEAEIVPQADLFFTIAAELIAEYHRDLPVGVPMVREPTDEEHAVVRRASLLHAVLCHAVAEQPQGIRGLDGVYGLVFCGKSDAAKDERHTFAPQSWQKSAGTQLKAFNSALVPMEWEGETPASYPVLRDYGAGKLNVFRYHIPLPKPNPILLTVPFPFSTTLDWYDLATLDVRTPQSTGEVVMIADFLFVQHVKPLEIRERSVTIVPAFPAVSNTNKDRPGFRNNERTPPSHALGQSGVLAEGTLEVHATYNGMRFQGRQASGFTLHFPLFTYKGNPRDLEVSADVEVNLELLDARPPLPIDEVAVDPQLVLVVARPRENGISLPVVLLDSHDSANLAGKGTGAKGSVKRRCTAIVRVGDKGVPAEMYALDLLISVATELWARSGVPPPTGPWAKGKIAYKVSGFRMRWM